MHIPSGNITIFLSIIIMCGVYTLPAPPPSSPTTPPPPPTTTPKKKNEKVDTGICQRTFPCFNMGKCEPKKDARGEDYDYSCKCYEDYFDVADKRSGTKLCTALKDECKNKDCTKVGTCHNDWGSYWCKCWRMHQTEGDDGGAVQYWNHYNGRDCEFQGVGNRPGIFFSVYDPDAIAGHQSFLYFVLIPENEEESKPGDNSYVGFQTGEGTMFQSTLSDVYHYKDSVVSPHLGYYLKYLKSRACRTFLHRKRLVRARSTVDYHLLVGYTYHLKDKDLKVRSYIRYVPISSRAPIERYGMNKTTTIHVYSDPEECTPSVEIIGCSPYAAGFNLESNKPFLWDYIDGHTFRPYIVQACLKENSTLRLAWISHGVRVDKEKKYHQQLAYKGSARPSGQMVSFDEWILSPGFNVPPYYNYSVIELLVYETVDEARVKKKISFFNSVQCQLNDYMKNPIINVWGGNERNHGKEEDLILNISNTFLPWNKYPYYWEGNPDLHHWMGFRVCLEIPGNRSKQIRLGRDCYSQNYQEDTTTNRTIPGAVLSSWYMKYHELDRNSPIVLSIQLFYGKWWQKVGKDADFEYAYANFDGRRFCVYPKPSVKIHLVPGSLPSINIRCVRNCGKGGPWKNEGLKDFDGWDKPLYFGASNDLMIDKTRVSVFLVECYERCKPEYNQFDAYKWEVFTSNDGGEQKGSFNINWEENLSPENSKLLILKENTLQEGYYYIKATLSTFKGGTQPWTTYITHISGGVAPGSCELKPEGGISGITEFTISCKNFDNGFKFSNLNYEFYQIQERKSGKEKTFLEWALHSEVGHIVLAKGNETSSYVKVNVTDNFGNTASVEVPVNLTYMNEKQVKSMTFNKTDAMSVVNRAHAGDNSGTVRIASALVDALRDLDEPQEEKVQYVEQIAGALSRNEISGIEGVRQMRMILNKISNAASSTMNVEIAILLMMSIRNAAKELNVYSETYWSNTESVVEELTFLVRQVAYVTHLLLESIEDAQGEDIQDYSEYIDLKRIEEIWSYRKYSRMALSVLRTLAASYLNRRVETEKDEFKKTKFHTMLWVNNGTWFEDKVFGDNRTNFFVTGDLDEDIVYGLVVFRLSVDIFWWRSQFQNMIVNSHTLFTYMEEKVYTRSYGDEVKTTIFDTPITYKFNLTINETKIKETEGSFHPYTTDDPFEKKAQIYRFLMNRGQQLSLNFTKFGVSTIKVVITVNKEPTIDDFSSAFVVGKPSGSTAEKPAKKKKDGKKGGKKGGKTEKRHVSFLERLRRKKYAKGKKQMKPTNYEKEAKTVEEQDINDSNPRKMKDPKVYGYSEVEGKTHDPNIQEYLDNEEDEHNNDNGGASNANYIGTHELNSPKESNIEETGDEMNIYPESSDFDPTVGKETIITEDKKDMSFEKDEIEVENDVLKLHSTYKIDRINATLKGRNETLYVYESVDEEITNKTAESYDEGNSYAESYDDENEYAESYDDEDAYAESYDDEKSYYSGETHNIAWHFKGFRLDYKWNESEQDYEEHVVNTNKTLNKTKTIDYIDTPTIVDDGSWVYVALMPDDDELKKVTAFAFKAVGSSCQVWENDKWNTSSCEISTNTPAGQITCACDSLGIVSAGTYSIPGTLYVSEKILASTETPSVHFDTYIVICFIWFIFILMLIWAIFKDREEPRKRNVVVLADNDVNERYGYLLTVYTGSLKDSGTSSKIGIRLYGSTSKSAAHILRSDTRPVLQDGSTDWFLIYTKESLGNLVKINLWSNSEGHRQAWFCSHIVVRDLQEQKSWVFMVHRWVSLARGDGLINFHLRPTTLKDIHAHNRRLFTNVVHFGGEGHMWINSFTEHPRSFYTNWERVIVCAFTTLLGVLWTILFFYLFLPSNHDSHNPTLKLIHLAFAIVANIFSLPANFFFSFIFRKSPPVCLRLKKYNVPAAEDVKLDNFFYFDAEKAKRINGIRKIFFYMLPTNPLCESHMPFKERLTNLRKPKETCKDHKRKQNKKKRKLHYHSNYFFLPCAFRVLGWLMCVIGILALTGSIIYLSLFLVPEVNSYIWFSTVAFMISTSIIVVEPIKSCITAFIATFVIKTEPMDTDMQRGYPLYPVNEHRQKGKILTLVRCLQEYKPITAMYIPELRAREKIRLKWQEVCSEVIFCFIFFVVVFASLYSYLEDQGSLLYHTKHIKDMFDRAVYFGDGLKSIRDIDGVYKYLNETFVPVFDLPETKEEHIAAGFLVDHALRFVGIPRVRQLRVKRGYACENEDVAQMLFCCPRYSSDTQDIKSYYMNWETKPPEGDLYSERAKEWFWRYRNNSETKSFPYQGEIALYSGGGYVTDLGRAPTNMKITVDYMKANRWLDTYTRFIDVELILYSGNTGYLSVVNIVFENDATRYFTTDVTIHTINLHKSPVAPTVVMETIFCLVIALYVFHQIVCLQMYSFKKYFTDIWSIYDILLAFLAMACVGFYLIRRIRFLHMRFILDRTHDNQFLAIFDACLTDDVFNRCAALLIFFTTIRIVKPICYIPLFFTVKKTLVLEMLALVFVTLLMVCLMIIFALFGHLATSSTLYEFRSPLSGCMTIIAFLYLNLGNVFHNQHWIIKILYCVMGVISCIFALNMYRAILLEACLNSKLKVTIPKVDYSLIRYIKDEYKYLRNVRRRPKKMRTKRLRGGADVGDEFNLEETDWEENDDSNGEESETETRLTEMSEKLRYVTADNMQERGEENLEHSLKERKFEIGSEAEKGTEVLHCFLKNRVVKDEETRVARMDVVNIRLKRFKERIQRATHVIRKMTEDTIKIRNKQDGDETV